MGSAGMFDAIMRSGIVAPYLASATFFDCSDQTKTIRRLLAMQIPTEAVMDWGRRPHNYSWQHHPATKKPATSHVFSLYIDHRGEGIVIAHFLL